ncbi:MAG: hypothetical protein R3F61_04130 [Myxococcota bacterium]
MLLMLAALLVGTPAFAGSDTTRDSFDRLEELLELRVEDGRLDPAKIVPVIVVSTQPRYEESAPWFATRALEVLGKAFGTNGLRLCEACMAPRAFVEDGHLAYQTGPVGIDEIVRLDEQSRGSSQPAKSAIWIDEHSGGISVRIVDLATSRVVYAQNIDPSLVENRNTKRMYRLADEYERRARGDSLTQAFVDLAIYPGQHLSIDWTDQWGKTNANLSGVTLSLFDPVVGIGMCHYRRIPFLNLLFGGKVILSMPTTLVRVLGSASDNGDFQVIDPLLTGVGVVRVPFGRSNYGVVLTASTNGQIGLGLSLMNISLLPVLP